MEKESEFTRYSLLSPEQCTFQQHSIEIYHAIDDPDAIASKLFSEGIITFDVKEKLSALRSTLEKNDILLGALEGRLRDAGVFDKFLRVLQSDNVNISGELRTTVGRMRKTYDVEKRREYVSVRRIATIRSQPHTLPWEMERSSENFPLSSMFRSRYDNDLQIQFVVTDNRDKERIRFDVKEDVRLRDLALAVFTLNQYGHFANDQIIWQYMCDGQRVYPVFDVVKDWNNIYIANPKGTDRPFTVEVHEMRKSS